MKNIWSYLEGWDNDMSFLKTLMMTTLLMSAFLVPKPLQVNYNSIPQNSELDSKYALRLYNPQVDDQSIAQFLFPDTDTSCFQVLKGDVRNETASFLDFDLADYYQIVQTDTDQCHYYSSLETSDGILTMLIAKSPMAGYPEFPMIKDEPVFTLEGKSHYQLYEGEIVEFETKHTYTRLYANFELNGQYVFVRTQYYKEITDKIKEELLSLLDRVNQFYSENG